MAASYSRSHLLQTQKPFSVLLLSSIAFFLLLLNRVSSTDEISFSFKEFPQNPEDLIFQGDAQVSGGEIKLTKPDSLLSVGRVLYAAPVRIWEDSTGSEASFETHFTFAIKSPIASTTADGLTFFLAPTNTEIPPDSTGGKLGLFDDIGTNVSRRTVAVEFDTYSNRWDPAGRHIGIDVNSIVSIKNVTWGWQNASVAEVIIKYVAATNLLSAGLTYPDTGDSYIVSDTVILRDTLPEWARIGFSAANSETVYPVETHDILSWSFTSSLNTKYKSSGNGRAKKNNVNVLRLGRFA